MSSKVWSSVLLSSMLLAAGVAHADNSKVKLNDVVELNDSSTIVLNSIVMDDSVSKLLGSAIEKSNALPPGQPLYLYINSPGGSVVAGLDLINGLKALGREVKTITNFSASMAFITVQSLGERIVTPTGVLMSHHAAGGVDGIIPGSINTRVNFWNDYIDSTLAPVAKRLGMSVEQLHEKDQNEWWTFGKNAVQEKTADSVKLVTCDRSMAGSYDQALQTFFGPVMITWAKCPLIKYPLAINFKAIQTNTMSVFELRQLQQDVHEYLYDQESFAEHYRTSPRLREMFK